MLAVIDSPTESQSVDRFGFNVRGWIWLGDAHGAIDAVELWSHDRQIGETPVLLPRPDVCAALGLDAQVRTGFELLAQHPAVARAIAFPVSVRVRFGDGTRSGVLCNRQLMGFGAQDLALADDENLRKEAVTSSPPALPPSGREVTLPLRHLQVRQVGGEWGPAFYESGAVILRQLGRAFEAAGCPLERADSVLDFGCGCGRVLRNLETISATAEVWGCDIDEEAIAWDRVHLGHIARFVANPTLPPTSFRDGQFQAIYSVSVFTHLPEEFQFAWLTEMRRILRPGGVFIATVHGAHHWAHAAPDLRMEMATRGFAYRTGARTEGLPEFYMVAFHSEAYIRRYWSTFFEILWLGEKYIHGVHDAVIMRRRQD